MVTEKRKIEKYVECGKIFGHIELAELAIPSTIKVVLNGEVIRPVSFDVYGHPTFSYEQLKKFEYMEYMLKREKGRNAELLAKITYVPTVFTIDKWEFDSIDGICNSLKDLITFNHMLINRKRYYFYNKQTLDGLKSFVVLGKYWLCPNGDIMTLKTNCVRQIKSLGKVETFSDFTVRNAGILHFIHDGYVIPKEGSRCPCCGKKLSMDDVAINPCVRKLSEYYHESCLQEHVKQSQILKYTKNMMDGIYRAEDYTFELLENPFLPSTYAFLFHTIDGDILIEPRANVINIEWKENYPTFDIKRVFFYTKDIAYRENNSSCIYASNIEKAKQYLRDVREIVNPDYIMYNN